MTKDEILQKAKPILFNTEMVRAILDGRKTETRRVMKPQPLFYTGRKYIFADDVCPKKWEDCDNFIGTYKYQPGDYLYVRETWSLLRGIGKDSEYVYKATDTYPFGKKYIVKFRWYPSIHMPKEAARIFLKVTGVKVERLQEIMERGRSSAEAEGFVNDINLIDGTGASATRHFADTWDNITKPADRDKYGWTANPWVWVCKFEKVIPVEN